MSGPSSLPLPSVHSPSGWTRSEGGVRLVRWARPARIILVGAWLLAALIHLFAGRGGRPYTWPPSYLVLELLACASLAFRAWHHPGKGRLAWSLLAASALLEVPNLLFDALQLRGFHPGLLTRLSSFLTLATGILVVAGILNFPKGREGRGMFRRRAMDSLIFTAALLFLFWVMGIQGSLRAAAPGVGFRVFAAYLNLALLGGGLVFMTSYHPDRARGPLGWFGGSALAWLAGISCWTLAGFPKVVATEGWIIVAACIPLFQGLAAWSPRAVEEALVEGGSEGRLPDLLPYLPVVLSLLVMTGLLAWAPTKVSRGAMVLFLAMVVLILLRQFQAVLDLLGARKTLNEQVLRRTKALKQAQETLLRTERMNTLALMGAGLAHDLNNLLCAMKGTAELAAMNLEDGLPPSQGDLDRIATSADRAASLTRRLMEFVRREEECLAPTELGRELMDMERDLRLLLPRSIAFRLEVEGTDPLVVMSSRLRLEQMLVNLVANAVDAMPTGGNLLVRVAPEPDGERVLIEVVDSGEGMDAQILARVFDPFFTTKAPGKGTGLGLSSLKALVEEGEGRLDVESEPGHGSRFQIRLPRLAEGALSPR